MNRLLSILALLVSAAVIVVALVEIAHRQHSTPLAAAPSALPSPTASAPSDVATSASSGPSVSETTPVPTPAETAAPPPTATPEPPLATQNALDTTRGTTPHTGANPVPAGIGVTLLALTGVAVERRTRRSY